MNIVAMGIGIKERDIPRSQSDDYHYMVLHEAGLLLKSPLIIQREKKIIHCSKMNKSLYNIFKKSLLELFKVFTCKEAAFGGI